MRCRYCILIVLTVFVLQGAFAQGWEWQNPLPSGFYYSDVVIFNQNEFLISSLSPVLIRTTDGGVSWDIERTKNDSISFWKISNHGDTVVGFAVTRSEGFILQSFDQGKSFQKVLGFAGDSTMPVDFQLVHHSELLVLSVKNASIVLSRTSDGGLSWEDHLCPANSSLYHPNGNKFCFSDYQNGIIPGPDTGYCSVFVTSDGGRTWTRSAPNYNFATTPIIPLIFADDSTVFGMTLRMGFSYLLKSTDAGMNWYINRNDDDAIPSRMIVLPTTSALCYVAAKASDKIFMSTNNGISWAKMTENKYAIHNGLASLAFLDSLFGIAVGIGSQIMRTVDGGLSWDYIHRGHRAIWNDLFFHDAQSGLVGGMNTEDNFGGLVYQTSNGGRSWTHKNLPLSSILSIDFINRDTGWICGEPYRTGTQAMIFKTANGGKDWSAVYSRPGVDSSIFTAYDISFPTATEGWVAAGNGLLHTSDGGTSWMNLKQRIPVASNYSVDRIEFLNERSGIALLAGSENRVRDRTVIFRTTDSGVTWEMLFSKLLFVDSKGLTTGFRLVDFIIRKPNAIWVQCESLSRGLTNLPDTLFRSTDAGTSWEALPCSVGFRDPRQPMFFFDESNGWTYSGYHTFTTRDGGKTWAPHASYTNLLEISAKTFFVNQNIGWAAGQNGEILHTTTGGLNTIAGFPQAPSFSLSQNYPNPTSSLTTIPFEITSDVASRNFNHGIRLVVYDLLGREVATIARDQLEVGKNQISFDASRLQAGVYCYRLMVGEQAVTRKMVVVR